MYMVISKPKRISVKSGFVHMVYLQTMDVLLLPAGATCADETFSSNYRASVPWKLDPAEIPSFNDLRAQGRGIPFLYFNQLNSKEILSPRYRTASPSKQCACSDLEVTLGHQGPHGSGDDPVLFRRNRLGLLISTNPIG